ncbi:M12 family metallo-peptidase [Pseudomarimonas arenosa]|uniref:Peptidase M12B domain-containing protein n=1 Tax=Pseudomarimonas arenosa TaxID=2774145 RepID=A0AAW3ZHW6_9GAMM|nr:M12 family metallo-peptidase [Pseudomarimonas arenosa]MBD8525005.1 hypothetical protein [Pseudomarimonas arenosa]
MRHLILALASFAASGAAQAIALEQVAVGETISVPAFRYAADKAFSQDLHLKRIEVYAPDARILAPLPDGGFRELPRSDRLYFVADRDKTASRLFLSVSADGADVRGSLFDVGESFDFAGTVIEGRFEMSSFAKTAPSEHEFACGNRAHEHAVTDALLDPLADSRLAQLNTGLAKGATHQAVLAIDTDNELLQLRFSDNLSAATSYLADLVTGINVAYARDLGFNLVQGTTLLRAQTVSGADPYSATATGNQLGEVGALWSAQPLTNESRAFVAFLSGKHPSTNGGSGIAWVLSSGAASNYCTAKNLSGSGGQVAGHYSATQIIRGTGFAASVNVNLVGHEIGHNLGAHHTHCSNNVTGAGTTPNNTIDRCFSGEGGCYSGTRACPTDNSVSGRGSIMSYCNFSGSNGSGGSCGSTLNEFHPAHQTLLSPRIASNVSIGCFTALSSNVGPTLSANSPGNGSNTTMAGGLVGANVTTNITFNRSGGSGGGTTSLSCNASGGNLIITSGTPQSIPVNGTVAPVVARFTLTNSMQSGSVSCTATPQGGTQANFNYSFTAPAGSTPTACPSDTFFRSGFETGEDNCD